MNDIPRIKPDEARRHVEEGALLVCSYEDEQKCRDMLLENALTRKDFESRAATLPKDREIIFY